MRVEPLLPCRDTAGPASQDSAAAGQRGEPTEGRFCFGELQQVVVGDRQPTRDRLREVSHVAVKPHGPLGGAEGCAGESLGVDEARAL